MGVPRSIRRWAVATFAAASWTVPGIVHAQTINGVVVEEGTEQGVAGAVVTLLDPSGTERGAVLSDSDGSFEIRIGEPGRYRLRVERIGHASAESEFVSLRPGQIRAISIVAPIEAVELEAIRVDLDHACEVHAATGEQLALVWAEARKALVGAYLTRSQRVYEYDLSEFKRVRDAWSWTVIDEHTWFRSDRRSSSPYVSRSAQEFALRGYADVTEDNVRYYGPDPAALVSDSFLDRHCFKLVERRGRRRLLGIAFSPVASEERIDIEGTLWVDGSNAVLDHLEFEYVGLPWKRAQPAGGRIDYRRLPDGDWIVESWLLRAPLFAERLGDGPVLGIKEVGGKVTAIRGPENPEAAAKRSRT